MWKQTGSLCLGGGKCSPKEKGMREFKAGHAGGSVSFWYYRLQVRKTDAEANRGRAEPAIFKIYTEEYF